MEFIYPIVQKPNANNGLTAHHYFENVGLKVDKYLIFLNRIYFVKFKDYLNTPSLSYIYNSFSRFRIDYVIFLTLSSQYFYRT